MEIASHKGYNDWKNEVNLCQFCKSSRLKFDDVTPPRLLVTDRGGLWCCNILMLMSWLSLPSPTCHGVIFDIDQYSWILSTMSLNDCDKWAPPPLITTQPPLHLTLGDPRVHSFPVLQISDPKIIKRGHERLVDWHLFLRPTLCCDVWLLLGVIVRNYSWLSRDNKRRRGANTQAWQTQ